MPWPDGGEKCDRLETGFAFWQGRLVLLCGAYLPDPSPGHGRRRAHRILLAIHDLHRSCCQKLAGARWSLRPQPSPSVYRLDLGGAVALSTLCFLERLQDSKQRKMVGELCLRPANSVADPSPF